MMKKSNTYAHVHVHVIVSTKNLMLKMTDTAQNSKRSNSHMLIFVDFRLLLCGLCPEIFVTSLSRL